MVTTFIGKAAMIALATLNAIETPNDQGPYASIVARRFSTSAAFGPKTSSTTRAIVMIAAAVMLIHRFIGASWQCRNYLCKSHANATPWFALDDIPFTGTDVVSLLDWNYEDTSITDFSGPGGLHAGFEDVFH